MRIFWLIDLSRTVGAFPSNASGGSFGWYFSGKKHHFLLENVVFLLDVALSGGSLLWQGIIGRQFHKRLHWTPDK